MAIPTEHVIEPSRDPKETVDWLESYGYRVTIVGPHTQTKDSLPGFPTLFFPIQQIVSHVAVLFAKKNQPVHMAQVGDVLVWDGEQIKIKE